MASKTTGCSDVLISEGLGKQAESSSRITSVEYKHTCQLLRHQLESHKTPTYSKLSCLLLRGSKGNDVSDVH